MIVGSDLEHPAQIFIFIRDPGVSIFAVRPEGNQAEGVGQDPVGCRHRGQAFRITLASLHQLPAQKNPFEPCLDLIPAEDLFLHTGPWALHGLA